MKAGWDVNTFLSPIITLILCGPIPDKKQVLYVPFPPFPLCFSATFSVRWLEVTARKQELQELPVYCFLQLLSLLQLYWDAHWDCTGTWENSRELLPSAFKLLKFSWSFLASWSNGSFLPQSCRWSRKNNWKVATITGWELQKWRPIHSFWKVKEGDTDVIQHYVPEEEGQEVLLHKMGTLQRGKYMMEKNPGGGWVALVLLFICAVSIQIALHRNGSPVSPLLRPLAEVSKCDK